MLRFSGEPPLTELLADPIMTAMMHSDSVEPRDLKRLLRAARDNRAEVAWRETDPRPGFHR